MHHRLFIATPLTLDFSNACAEYQKKLLPICTSQDANIHLVPTANLHITISFLGELDAALLPRVIDTVQSVARLTPRFFLEFETIFFSPPSSQSAMIWAIFRENKAFEQLAHHINVEREKLLGSTIFQGHHFIPHVTLARFRKPVHISNDMLPAFSPPTRLLPISNLYVYESHLHKDGAMYSVRALCPLQPTKEGDCV